MRRVLRGVQHRVTVATTIALIITASALSPTGLHAQASSPAPSAGMTPQRLLVHITAGPNDPTRAALGFNVAKAALDAGHSVTIFLAGDGVQLLRDGTISALVGLGTGSLKELYDGFIAKGGKLYASGGSASARGLSAAELQGKPVELAGPPQLVQLIMQHDKAITY